MDIMVVDGNDQPPTTAGGSDILAEGTGVEPASDKCAVVFGTTALPVRLPFQHFRLAIGDCRFLGSSDLPPDGPNRQLIIGDRQ